MGVGSIKYFSSFSLWLLALLLLEPGPGLLAQRTAINGHVYDAKTKEPLPFVNVAFKSSKVGATTDMNGKYSIETYYAGDSLMATFVGYKPQAKKVRKDVSQSIDFYLQEGSVSLGEIVVNAQDFENPAHEILRNIIRNKPINNRAKLDAFEYETYNKVQFDINNFSDKFTKRKIFKNFDFIFDYVDSTDSKVSLPFFMTENLSNFYYQQKPKGRKEIIRATKVSGINNESISQFLGQMYQDVNVYENSISIFGKNFVSPISNYGLVFYKYFLSDSTFIDDKWCYKLDFQPKNENELVFKGHFWVNDTTYAIKTIDAEILKSANINFITELKVHHAYDEVEHEVWMLTKEDLLVDFSLLDQEMGFYGRKTTTYRDFVINQPKEAAFYEGPEQVIVETQVNEKDAAYWERARHEEITDNQQGIYDMVDSLKSNKIFMTYVDVVNFLIQGYRIHGPVEIGPVFTFLSYNSVEGVRPKFGLRTSNDFSTRLMLEGYGAYGFNDQEFKFMAGGSYFLSKKPRQIVGARFTRDMDLVGQVPNYFPRDHVVQFLTLRNPQDRLIFSDRAEVYLEREWFTGFSSRVDFVHSDMQARGDWEFTRFSPEGPSQEPVLVDHIIDTRVRLRTRFAFRETFVSGEFERISLGTKWPVIHVTADFGIKGVFGSQYEYQKLSLSVADKIPLGPFGNFYFAAEGGKTWNSAPYPLLFMHNGNESLFFNSQAFNSMNFFEFVSDRYISLKGEYHLEGFFLNKIPLFQRLKWRELIGFNGLVGGFDDANLEKMLLPERTFSLDSRPYAEVYIGVENILKFIRVDAIWRLSYLDNPNVRKFGILIGFDIQF